MFPVKPISYQSLKSIIKSMDANQRFELSRRCPSIRSIERNVPLKIEFLEFHKSAIVVNDIKYQIGLCRNYDGDTPEIEMMNTEEGGVAVDQDNYGCDLLHREDETLSDGRRTIILREPRDIRQASNDEIIVQLMRQGVRINIEPLPQLERNGGIYQPLAQREKLIDHLRKHNRVAAPFKHFVQLTVTRRPNLESRDEDVQLSIERTEYSKKLFEYMTPLSDFFFKDRNVSVVVENMKIFETCILQFPINLKFHLHGLSSNLARTGWVIETLNPVIDPTSFPLRFLRVFLRSFFAETIDHPHVRNAKKLEIVDLRRSIRMRNFKTLHNPCVHLVTQPFTPAEYGRLVEDWLRERREVGIRHEFTFSVFEELRESFNFISASNPTAVVEDRSITIPVDNMKNLFINYVHINRNFWKLNMETIELH